MSMQIKMLVFQNFLRKLKCKNLSKACVKISSSSSFSSLQEENSQNPILARTRLRCSLYNLNAQGRNYLLLDKCGKSLLVLFASLLPFMERQTIEDFPYNMTELIGNI